MQKWIFLLMMVICGIISANTNFKLNEEELIEKVLGIKLQATYLEKQRDLIQQRIDRDHFMEMKEEIQGQSNMISYNWGAFTSKLKNAEEYEILANRDKEYIKVIDRQLIKLNEEMNTLLNFQNL